MLETGISPDMKLLLILITLTYVIALIIIYKLKNIGNPTKEQGECEHDWHILTPPFNRANKFTIYCPKCKYEKKVNEEEWAKMQIDKSYEAGIGRCED